MRYNSVLCAGCGSATKVIRTTNAADGSVIRRHQCTACARRVTLRTGGSTEPSGEHRPLSAAEAKRFRKRLSQPSTGASTADPATSSRGGLPVGPISQLEGLTFHVDFLE